MKEQEFTNLDKVFWPDEGYTKGDVLEYYKSISKIILPYLKDRPMVLKRNPNGIADKGFFQKDVASHPDFVKTTSIQAESTGEKVHYVLCNDEATLLYLVQLGCIELNPWNSRVKSLTEPDYLIFDIDPNGVPFETVVVVAQIIHEILDMACEESYCKTSGKTGLHVYVPLGARYGYEQAKQFARLVVEIAHSRLPDVTSLEHSPEKRRGKIYFDIERNAIGQTAAAPYCIRPFPGATVSTPLEWREVKRGLDAADFTIKTVAKRLKAKKDIWKPVLSKGVDLKAAVMCLEEELQK
jgi:bifunctional non-homologous end joining protein LigD